MKQKAKSLFIMIIVILIMSNLFLGLVETNKVLAATTSEDINAIDTSKYPGIK